MSSLKQVAMTAAANLGAIGSGMALGFSAVALPAMKTITEEQASWVASIASIGMPFGCLLIPSLLDGLGRKRTLMLVSIPAIIGWTFIATAYEPWLLYQVYAGRFLNGIALILACQPAVVYVSEVTDKKLRGVLTTWTIIAVSVGIIIVYVLGAVFKDNWRLVAGICVSFPAVALAVVWTVLPESPVWLTARGRHEDAEFSMRKIRNVKQEQDLPERLKQEMEAMLESSNSNPEGPSFMNTLQFMKRPEAYKPFLIMNFFQIFQQFTGIFVVIFYLVNMVRDIGVEFDSYLATILIGLGRFVGAITISFASRWCGRRILGMISGLGMAVTLGALVVYMKYGQDSSLDWFPVVALVLYIFASTLGFLTLPFSMLGEVFPSRIRASGSGATSFIGCCASFIALKMYPDMKAAWGLENVFTFYAIVSLIGTGFVYLFLPETQGKTLQEVERHFRGESLVRVNKNKQQYILGAVANIASIAAGMTLGFSAVALPPMQMQHHSPQVSHDQASWIASLASIATPIGCLIIGGLLDGLGRKRAMMLVNVPAVIGWLLIATTSSHEHWFFYQVYVGRILTGIATGMSSTPATVYVSEVADRSLRGVLVTWTSIGISLGILIVYVLGALLQEDWRLVAGISAAFPILSIINVWFFVPESPTWLAARGHLQEAETCMRKVRGISREENLPDELQKELDSMALNSNNNNDNQKQRSWRDIFTILKKPEAYKPLLIMNAFFFFQQWAGIFVVVFYAVSIVTETGVKFDGYIVTVMIGISRLVVSIGISFASKKYGRRVLTNISGVGMTMSICVLAAFLTLMHDNVLSEDTIASYSWVPVTALVTYILTSTVGFLTLPWAMIGEVFPSEIRGPACGFTTCMGYIFSFIIVKLYPEMKDWWGNHGVFTFYAGISVLGTVVMYRYLPETQGRTLDQIQQNFRKVRISTKEDKTLDGNAAAEILLMEKT
ncbi:hypothetical protein C0J52_24327 [Blattella germanica]|nr:hypothetical protein C0J52_24327 [Blattella germanica]